MRIYLAGPMHFSTSYEDGNRDLFDDWCGAYGDEFMWMDRTPCARWRKTLVDRAPFHDYLFPEQIQDGHAHDTIASTAREWIVENDLALIDSSDLLLAFLDSPYRYGTFAEIAYAKGAGKRVVACSTRDLATIEHPNWFSLAMAEPLLFPVTPGRSFSFGAYRYPEDESEALFLLSRFLLELPVTRPCLRCGRPLNEHRSVSSGLGPQCAAMLGREAFGEVRQP